MAELSNSRTSTSNTFADDDEDGGLIIPKMEEIQIMDYISCTIEDEYQNSVTGDLGLEGGSRHTHAPSIQEVLDKMKLLEAQVTASAMETQPLLYQVFAKCNKLEQRLKTLQKQIDRRFANLGKGPHGHGFSIPNFGLTSPDDASGSRLSRKNNPPKKRRRQQYSMQKREQNTSDDDEAEVDQDVDHYDSDSDWQPQPGATNDGIDVQHDEDDVDVEASDSTEEEVGSNSLLNTYLCKVCPNQVGFKTPEGLAKHYTKHHPITETGTVGTGTGTKLGSNPAKKRRVTKLSTRSKPDQSSCSEERTHTCSKSGCRKSFPTRWQLERHQMSAHQVIECHICQEEFIRKTDLAAHKTSVHPGDTFPCPEEGCGKIFRTDGSLKFHLGTCRRGPQPPLKCDECGKTLKNMRTMQRHKELVHQGLHRVVCSVCGKAIGVDGLKTHMRTHDEGYQRRTHFCETCRKGFITVQDLDNHRRTHTGERPFTCEDCGKTFASGSTLRGHRLIHTGKPHVCDLCGWGFAKRAAMVRHKAAHGRGTAKEGNHKGARRSLIVGHDNATGAVITKPATPATLASQNQDQQIEKSVQI